MSKRITIASASSAEYFHFLQGMEPTVSETYAVADYASPIEAARAFLSGPAAGHTPKRALIAAAGPVEHGRVAMTNAAWIVDSERISKGLAMTDVVVLNDFEALAWSLPALHAEHLVTLGAPRAGDRGTMAVLGPGSGFGLAAMVKTASSRGTSAVTKFTSNAP